MSTTIALDDLRRELPRGPEPKSALDRIVEQLATATGYSALVDKLVTWGWQDEAGRSLTWERWNTKRWGR
jgi:hypothetical protein